MSKVLSIELGYSLVRVCEIDFKVKKPKIYNNFEFKAPANCLEDGFIRDPEGLGNALKDALSQNNIKTKQVVYTISSAKIASRDTTLPFVKENKLDELVRASATDVFPVDITNCKITHQVLETQESEDGTKKYHVCLYAAPNDLLESYYTMSAIAGVQIVALDYSSNSFAVATKEVFVNGTHMAVKIDERSSLISVIKDGRVAFQRTVPYGGDTAIDTIIDLEEQESGDRVSYEKALGLLQMRSCIRSSIDPDIRDDEDGNDERIKQFRTNVADSLGMFNSSIMRVVDYYNSRNSDAPVESIYITGYAESFLGLTQLMSNELGLNVERLSDRSADVFSGLKEGGAYINCIGAAINSMDFIPDAHSTNKKGKLRKVGQTGKKGKPVAGQAAERDYTGLAVIIFIVSLLASIALAALTLLPYMEAEKKNKQLIQREAELAPISEVYRNKVYSEKYLEQVRNMYYVTQNRNDSLLLFISELERALPESVNVLTFSATSSDVTMTMNVDSKEAAAKTIQELRAFESIDSVVVNAISEETNALGGSVVGFTINCTYAPVPMDVGEDTATEEVATEEVVSEENTEEVQEVTE